MLLTSSVVCSIMSGNICNNCKVTKSPVWRMAKTLGVVLCNACHICWKGKGHQRAIPTPEQLAKTEAEYDEKEAKKVQMAVTVGANSDNATWAPILGGKRKRVAKDFGEDQECYGEGLLG